MALSFALPLWFAGVLAATVLFEPTSAVIMVGPAAAAEAASAAEKAAIIDARSGYVRMASLRKGFVRELYAHGAWMVWPAVDAGCAGLAG